MFCRTNPEIKQDCSVNIKCIIEQPGDNKTSPILQTVTYFHL